MKSLRTAMAKNLLSITHAGDVGSRNGVRHANSETLKKGEAIKKLTQIATNTVSR